MTARVRLRWPFVPSTQPTPTPFTPPRVSLYPSRWVLTPLHPRPPPLTLTLPPIPPTPPNPRLHVFTYPPDQYHPDKNAGSAHATDMFKKVSRAKVRVEKTPCVPVDLSYPHTPHMCSATPRASTQNMNSCWHAVFSQAPIGNRGSNRGSKLYLPARPRPPPLPKGCSLTLCPIGLNLCARRVLGDTGDPPITLLTNLFRSPSRL